MSEDRGSRVIQLFALKKPFRRIIRFSLYVLSLLSWDSLLSQTISCSHAVRLHPTTRPSSAALGLSSGLWGTP
jgi:hypothetical protein